MLNIKKIDTPIGNKKTQGDKLWYVTWKKKSNGGTFLIWAKDALKAFELVAFDANEVELIAVEVNQDNLPVRALWTERERK